MKLLAGSATLDPGAQSAEQTFWEWFRQHQPALLAVRTGREPVCEQLAAALHQVQPDLTFEFGPADHSPREFVVSADGIRDAFPAVERLTAAAPALPAWRIVAFRPGRAGPHVLEVNEVQVSSAEVLVRAEPDGAKTGLTLAMPGYQVTPRQVYEQAGYLLLDAVLGEHTVETRIGFIEFVAPERRPAGAWLPLEDLGAELRK